MPRFFFHLHAGRDRVADETGLELPSVADAICQGRRAMTELIAEECATTDGITAFEIQNEEGEIIFRTPASAMAAQSAA